MRRRHFLAGAGASALAGTALTGTGRSPARDARDALLAAFDRYPMVGGMSPSHGVKDVDDFLLALLRDPRLPEIVTDIAVEGGNSLYQPLVDRYIAGEEVPLAEVRQAWRNNTFGGEFSAFYERVYPLVRRINRRLPPDRKLRVLACEPPLDWATVTGPADIQAYLRDRDPHIASVLENEVLAKRRKALILMGTGHLRHGIGAAAHYEQHYPQSTFVVIGHRGFAADNDELERRMAGWPVPSLARFQGTWLGELDSAYFSLPDDAPLDPGKGYPGVDGYLYCGPRDFLLHQPLSAGAILDRDFVAECERRAIVVHAAPDEPWHPAVLFEQEARSSVFLYDPAQAAGS